MCNVLHLRSKTKELKNKIQSICHNLNPEVFHSYHSKQLALVLTVVLALMMQMFHSVKLRTIDALVQNGVKKGRNNQHGKIPSVRGSEFRFLITFRLIILL